MCIYLQLTVRYSSTSKLGAEVFPTYQAQDITTEQRPSKHSAKGRICGRWSEWGGAEWQWSVSLSEALKSDEASFCASGTAAPG